MLTREECLALCIPEQFVEDKEDPVADQWCWHCCHGISGMVIPLPIKYNDRRQSWTYTGQFCSWGCAKGYALDHQKLEWCHLLSMLKRRVLGKYASIVPAPPRRCLSMFGGTMTLDEFRAKSDSGVVVGHLPPRMMPLEQIMVQRHIRPTGETTKRDPSMTVRMATTTEPKNETLRLKRPLAATKKSTGLDMFLVK